MREALIGAVRLLALGWIVVLAIVLGLVAGLWLDSVMHTSPLFTLIGVLLGVAAAFGTAYRLIRAVFEPLDKPRQ